MVDIMTILAKFRIYMDTETSYGTKTKSKYFNVTRAFLFEMIEKYKKMQFTTDDINQYITKKTTGDKRANNTKYALRSFLLSIGKQDWVNKLKPLKQKERKKKFPYYEAPVQKRIIKLLTYPYNAMAWIQAHTGCRFREAACMKIQDISMDDQADNLIFITVSDYAKGGKGRTVYLRKEHLPTLTKLFKDRTFGFIVLPDKCNYMNNQKLDNYLDNLLTYYNQLLNKIGQSLDITGLSSHYIRHHFADTYLLRGGSLHTLQKILGHAKIETTEKYVSVSEKMATKELSSMDVPM